MYDLKLFGKLEIGQRFQCQIDGPEYVKCAPFTSYVDGPDGQRVNATGPLYFAAWVEDGEFVIIPRENGHE